MPNYSTDLKTWGSSGEEPPDNYSYVEGEQPVDAWDNFFNSNVVSDIEHLIDVTNNELLARDGSVDIAADLTDDQGNTLWDHSEEHVPQESLENDSVTVTAGNQLTGGGEVALGDTITVDVDEGDGSGLDADTVKGNNIFVQSTQPSNPSDSDIWIDTSPPS